MPRLKSLFIEGFRSIKEELTIRFPENTPVVLLIGENNSGKSNVIRVLEPGCVFCGKRVDLNNSFFCLIFTNKNQKVNL